MESSIWVVYWNPTDYPNKYVARRFRINQRDAAPTSDVMITPVYSYIKDIMEGMGLTKLPHSEVDEPHIIENWL